MNISLTSYGGIEEKSQHDESDHVTQGNIKSNFILIASQKSNMKGNIKQPSNLLNELVYEIISDGD